MKMHHHHKHNSPLSYIIILLIILLSSFIGCKPGAFGDKEDNDDINVTPLNNNSNDGTNTNNGTDSNDGTDQNHNNSNNLNNTSDGTLLIKIFDVGQGNGVFIKTPWDEKVIIDTGRTAQAGQHMGEDLWGQTIDYVITSHFDEDHFGGLKTLIMGPDGKPGKANIDDDSDGETDCLTCAGEYMSKGSDDLKVLQFIDRGLEPIPTNDERYIYLAITDGLRRKAIPGEKLITHNNFEIQVLAVDGNIFDGNDYIAQDENSRSVVVYVRYRGFGFLVTGDLPTYLEQELAYQMANENMPMTIMMLGHHGSDSSTASQTLNLLKPEVAIISVGNSTTCGPGFNAFGHPAQEVLDRLFNSGVIKYVLQTNEGGARPKSGNCSPADGETYPRNYHSLSVIKSGGDIEIYVVPNSYNIIYSGN